MKSSFYREEKTPEEKALEALQKRYRKDGYKAKKADMKQLDLACKKCGWVGQLYNITYRNENKSRVITACVHCGYESELTEVAQGKLF